MQKTGKEKAWSKIHHTRAVVCGANGALLGLIAGAFTSLIVSGQLAAIIGGVFGVCMTALLFNLMTNFPSIFNELEEEAAVKSRENKVRIILLFIIVINALNTLFWVPSNPNSVNWIFLLSFVFGWMMFLLSVKRPKNKVQPVITP